MRILTVKQPWAWAILHAGKNVENRVRNLAGEYRGPVAIHAGKAFDDAGWDHPVLGPMLDEALRQGDEIEFTPAAIIGVVDLTDVHDQCWTGYEDRAGETHEEWCSPWAEPEVQHLVIANARPLPEPIPYTGALGLRHLDAATTAQILARIGEAA